MALNWNWDNKIGELLIRQGEKEFTMSIYQGNALAIFIHEYVNDEGKEVYSMYNFFCDKEHFKNCTKDKTWNYAEEWVKITLWNVPNDLDVKTKKIINKAFYEEKKSEQKEEFGNTPCVICGEASNGKEVCKKCYSEIMSTQSDLDKNKKPWELKDYYYNLKAFISRLKNHEEVTNNIYKLYAIAWLSKNLHNDEQLSDVVTNDVKYLIKIRDRLKEMKFDEQHKQNDKTIIAVADIEKNRATDGHICKSEGEVIIDDILYRGQVCHAYERRVKEIPQSERTVLADWFVPLNGFEGIYIEYWGMDTADYQDNKEEKLKLYEKYKDEVKLIQVNKNDVKDRQNLEDSLFQQLKTLGWKK